MSRAALARLDATKAGPASKARRSAAQDRGYAANRDADHENPIAEMQERTAIGPQWSFAGIKPGLPKDSGETQETGLTPAVNQALRAPGQPLDAATRGTMESRFAHDFSRVRIHADPQASNSARAVGAGAYTIGDHVVFGSGFYSPETQGGSVILAHELAHVVQQADTGSTQTPAGPAVEQEAMIAGEAIRRPGRPIRIANRTRLDVAAMSIAEARRALWGQVPDGIKEYVRPIAQEAAAQMDSVIPPNTEIPKPIEHLAEHPVDTLSQAVAHPLEAAEAVSETAKAVKPAAKSVATAIPHLVKAKAQQIVHDKVMGHLGEAKGVVLEATNIVDTVAWLPYAARELERKALGEGEMAEVILAVTDTVGGYVALDYLVKKGYAAKNPFTGKQTGAFSISGAVSQSIDEQADKVDRVLGDGKPEEALLFTSYEQGELKGAIGTQAGLAFVGVEEVQLALKVAGLLGQVKSIADAIEANPKGWTTDFNFWSGVISMVLTAAGLGSARVSQKIPKITKILLAGGMLAGVAPLVRKIYQDYTQMPEGSERDKALKQDLEEFIKVFSNLIMSMAHSGGKGKGGAAEQGEAGRSGEAAPGERVVPAEKVAPEQPALSAPPVEEVASAPVKGELPVTEPAVSAPKAEESVTSKPVAAEHPGPVVETPSLSKTPIEAPKAAIPTESSPAPVESLAPAEAPKAAVTAEPESAMSTTKEAEFQPVASESAAGAQPSMDAVPLAESTPAEPTILAEKTNASATEQTPIAKKEPAINPHQKADPQAQTAKANKQRATKIAEAEAELNEARKATVTYKDARKASGKNLKGGPIKRIWNAKERLWILKRQQAFPDRTILEQARIVGVKTPDGKMRPVSRISKTGRTHDFAEVRGTKVVGGDLKSTEEFLTSIEGGVKKAQTMEGEFRKSSKIGGQHKVEDKVRKAAIKSGGVIVMQGKNVLTGKIETIEVPAANYRSEVLTYEDVRPN